MRSPPSADFADLAALARVEGAELRGALIRAQAELFAAASALDQTTIRAFESVMTGLVPKASPDEAAAAAEILAPLPQTPPGVLVALIESCPGAARHIIAKAPALPRGVAAAAVAREPSLASAYAARASLPQDAPSLLALIEDDDIYRALAANPALALGGRTLLALIARAEHNPALAEALFERDDLSVEHRAALYRHADDVRRHEIRAQLAARPDLDARPAPVGISASIDRLVEIAGRGEGAAFARVLADAIGAPDGLPWDYETRGGRELTALALTALGSPPPDAIRIFLTLDLAVASSAEEVFHLAALVRSTPRDVALRIVEASLGRSLREGRRGRHVPHAGDNGAVRRSVFGLLRTSQGHDREERAAR
jgi:uncharacterized protein (DUF2336 family)